MLKLCPIGHPLLVSKTCRETVPLQTNNLKAAAKRRAKAPVDNSVCEDAAPLEVAAAVSPEVAEAVSELPPEVVELAVVSAVAEVADKASAVAFRMPHWLFCSHTL
jgi:hypothetical protein